MGGKIRQTFGQYLVLNENTKTLAVRDFDRVISVQEFDREIFGAHEFVYDPYMKQVWVRFADGTFNHDLHLEGRLGI